MSSYRVETPEATDDGIRVECETHGTSETFDHGHRKVSFYCADCGYEVGIDLQDAEDWRELTERC